MYLNKIITRVGHYYSVYMSYKLSIASRANILHHTSSVSQSLLVNKSRALHKQLRLPIINNHNCAVNCLTRYEVETVIIAFHVNSSQFVSLHADRVRGHKVEIIIAYFTSRATSRPRPKPRPPTPSLMYNLQ